MLTMRIPPKREFRETEQLPKLLFFRHSVEVVSNIVTDTAFGEHFMRAFPMRPPVAATAIFNSPVLEMAESAA